MNQVKMEKETLKRKRPQRSTANSRPINTTSQSSKQATKPKNKRSTKLRVFPVNRPYDSQDTPATKHSDTIFFYSHKFPKHRYLSQWYIAPFTDPATGHRFNCNEQWMMWNKALLFHDTEVAAEVLETGDPKAQKALGRRVKGFDAARWDEKKMNIVTRGNYLKFTAQDESAKEGQPARRPTALGRELMETGDADIVEASPSDRIWGIGMAADKAKHLHPLKWPGENLLGRALMDVREKLRKENGEDANKTLNT